MQAEPSGVLKSCVMICSVLSALSDQQWGELVVLYPKQGRLNFLPFCLSPFKEVPHPGTSSSSSWNPFWAWVTGFLSFCFLCYILPGKWDKCRSWDLPLFLSCYMKLSWRKVIGGSHLAASFDLVWLLCEHNSVPINITVLQLQWRHSPFLFFNVSIAGTSLRASLGLCF